MGKKYIIELNDDCQSEFKGIMALGLTQEKQISVELIPEEELTRYTEPDLEQVRKEAYEDGYNAGFGKKIHTSYQEGLADAWEAVRKIYDISQEDRLEIFPEASTFVIADICDRYSASECVEKIRQYEQEQDRQARIEYNFDEIKDVLETTAKECNVSLDEIAEVLQKMKESDNG